MKVMVSSGWAVEVENLQPGVCIRALIEPPAPRGSDMAEVRSKNDRCLLHNTSSN
jgi:hypothetical protein